MSHCHTHCGCAAAVRCSHGEAYPTFGTRTLPLPQKKELLAGGPLGGKGAVQEGGGSRWGVFVIVVVGGLYALT